MVRKREEIAPVLTNKINVIGNATWTITKICQMHMVPQMFKLQEITFMNMVKRRVENVPVPTKVSQFLVL